MLFDGVRDERFYFVHSYAAQALDARRHPPVPGARTSPGPTTAAASSPRSRTARSAATQFHPEKSGEPGIRLLRNWLGTL